MTRNHRRSFSSLSSYSTATSVCSCSSQVRRRRLTDVQDGSVVETLQLSRKRRRSPTPLSQTASDGTIDRLRHEAWSIPLSSEKLVAGHRPKNFYDLLPARCKNPSFVVQLDMEVPRPRFVIHHRAVQRRCVDLTPGDRQELLRAALDMVAAYDIADASLVVPLGAANRAGRLYELFYAYLLVPSAEHFSTLFQRLSGQLTQWPSRRWVTDSWTVHTADLNDLQHRFNLSVLRNLAAAPDLETAMLRRRGIMTRPHSKRKLFPQPEEPVKVHLVRREAEPRAVVGLRFSGKTRLAARADPVQRWKLFDAALQAASKADAAYFSISLTSGYEFGISDVHGMLAFPAEIPTSVLRRCNVTGERRKERAKA